jgi:sulfur dioxygenase
MIFRQLFDPESSTYTYLLGDPATGQAVLIDPVLEQLERDLSLVRELELRLTHVMETHVHADHITAAGLLRERTDCTVVASERGASCANLHVRHGDEVRVGALVTRVLATPGHTDDGVSYWLGDRVFTGDALLIRGTGRTDFQNGSAGQLHESITRVLFALPDDTLVYPAHDYQGRTVTTIGEEKRHNPRLAGRSREEFIHLMENLHLPAPRKLDVAVPANRSCGRLEALDLLPEHLDTLGPEVRRIDVREPEEFEGPLGHLPRAELVPLPSLEAASDSWPREAPLLLICRSGRRSVTAAQLLARRGFGRLYNLKGGMLAVREASAAPGGPGVPAT